MVSPMAAVVKPGKLAIAGPVLRDFARLVPTLPPSMQPASGPSMFRKVYAIVVAIGLTLAFVGERTPTGIVLFGHVPYAFVLFTLVLLGIGIFHHHTLHVTVAGAIAITGYTVFLAPEHHPTPETPGLIPHLIHEAEHTLLNLGGLLLGFTMLADLFERSHAPQALVRVLPKRASYAAFSLLLMVWLLSSFLDNIAGAMIGGVMVLRTFKTDVRVAYLAAIIAASNAGGAWSVLGDTTTTMMWIKGVPQMDILHCLIASAVAFVCFAIPAAIVQGRQPIATGSSDQGDIDKLRLLNVILVLAGAVTTAVLYDRPFVGVWTVLLVGSLWRAPTWSHLLPACKGTAFLLLLVWCASLMPVKALPPASWPNSLGLGFLSAVFDNIPLTKLALEQGGYDWGLLSFAVGFGGSMVWFGSSAGVALAAVFPSLRNTGRYVFESWPIVVAYLVGFFALLAVWGWQPTEILHKGAGH